MHSLNKWLVSICASIVIVLVQVIVTQYAVITSQRTELSFMRTSGRISEDQISDMMYELSKLRAELETNSTQQFIAGVAAAIERRDEFNAIWHAGYDRGSATQQYVNDLDRADKTAAYTDEKK